MIRPYLESQGRRPSSPVQYERRVGPDVLLPAQVEVVLAVDGADAHHPVQQARQPAPGGRQLVAVAALRAVEVDEPDGAVVEPDAPAEVVVVHGDDLRVVVVQAEVVVVVVPRLVAAAPASGTSVAARGTAVLVFFAESVLRKK